jgi:hypothetical protein
VELAPIRPVARIFGGGPRMVEPSQGFVSRQLVAPVVERDLAQHVTDLPELRQTLAFVRFEHPLPAGVIRLGICVALCGRFSDELTDIGAEPVDLRQLGFYIVGKGVSSNGSALVGG